MSEQPIPTVWAVARTCGVLPVADHLRPPPRSAMTVCPVYTRLPKPVDRPFWRHYDVTDFMPLPEASAVPIEGEA